MLIHSHTCTDWCYCYSCCWHLYNIASSPKSISAVCKHTTMIKFSDGVLDCVSVYAMCVHCVFVGPTNSIAFHIYIHISFFLSLNFFFFFLSFFSAHGIYTVNVTYYIPVQAMLIYNHNWARSIAISTMGECVSFKIYSGDQNFNRFSHSSRTRICSLSFFLLLLYVFLT